MSIARRLAFSVLGMVLGSSGGGIAGLLAGLAYTEIAATSGFEGYSGYVVAYWILGGVAIGTIVGLIVAYRFSRLRTT
jgi:ABC-type branched-subunit amino acid transport system permease subunit